MVKKKKNKIRKRYNKPRAEKKDVLRAASQAACDKADDTSCPFPGTVAS